MYTWHQRLLPTLHILEMDENSKKKKKKKNNDCEGQYFFVFFLRKPSGKSFKFVSKYR